MGRSGEQRSVIQTDWAGLQLDPKWLQVYAAPYMLRLSGWELGIDVMIRIE